MRNNTIQGSFHPSQGPTSTDPQTKLIHLYIRGNYRQDIFFDEKDFINAWNRLWLSAKAIGVEIMAAELLSNHFHICLRIHPPKPQTSLETGKMEQSWAAHEMSRFVHHLRMSLSYYFNRRYNVQGSLGSRRYCSANVIPIDEDGGEDLRDLIRYIHRNVKHHGITNAYPDWPYSTFKHIFNLSDRIKKLTGKTIPKKLLYTYLPHTCVFPEDWSMTTKGLIIPPPEIFPSNDIEQLFESFENYQKACDTPTRREAEHEAHELKLGHTPKSKVLKISDQQIIDYIQEKLPFPIVTMTKEQRLYAAIAAKKAFPKVPFRQLSRILHVPATTIHTWNKT